MDEYAKTEVLVYPNITFARNLEADSYVVVVGPILRQLAKTHPQLHFTLLLPERVESLALPNVRQVRYPLPTYPNKMRAHFDTRWFLAAVDWKRRSYDVVWSHLPEHTLQIKNVFYNSTNERPVFVGYCHWYEVAENTTYPETLLPHNLAGTLAMRACGLNSEWLRQLVLDRAAEILNEATVDRLGEILRPQYLGTDPVDVDPRPERGRIVFNHRANDYTGFREAVEAFDSLWARRQDFRVAFTLAAVDRPWAERVETPDRDAYLRELARAWIGVGRFKTYSAWSISTMDGLSLGVPYVLPEGLCYPEMVGRKWPLLYRDPAEFLERVEAALDQTDLRELASRRAREIADSFLWENRAPVFAETIEEAAAAAQSLSRETPKLAEIRRMAEAGLSKEQITGKLGWGVGIPWTPYRTRLRTEAFQPSR